MKDPGNAGTAGQLHIPADWHTPTVAEHKRKANAVAMGVLLGLAILGGGLGALFVSPAWMPPVVAFIGYAGLGCIASAINHARFGPTPRSGK